MDIIETAKKEIELIESVMEAIDFLHRNYQTESQKETCITLAGTTMEVLQVLQSITEPIVYELSGNNIIFYYKEIYLKIGELREKLENDMRVPDDVFEQIWKYTNSLTEDVQRCLTPYIEL